MLDANSYISPKGGFTFHYVYIYIQLTESAIKNLFRLYIPLCLYLYELSKWKKIQIWGLYIPLCLYLYIPAVLHMIPGYILYIPLCLYLYEFSNQYMLFLRLYIPLCLYLYARQMAADRRIRLPLHSTMFIFILLLRLCLELLILLYIPLCLYLYFYVTCPFCKCRKLYIPLCLYLYSLLGLSF